MKDYGSSVYLTNFENDVLSDMLQFIGLKGRFFCRSVLTSPWALEIPADNILHFHFVERGSCRIRIEGQAEDRVLSAGDLAILTRGKGHVLYDATDQDAVDIRELIKKSEWKNSCTIVQYGGGGDQVRLLCGSFYFKPGRQEFIVPYLPPVMVIFGRSGFTRSVLESVLSILESESGQRKPGAGLILSRLVEILFVEVLREWFHTHEDNRNQSWLLALRDDKIASALQLIHSKPQHPWTVESLAYGIGMSRSPFAARFKEWVGTSPLDYLTKLRMLRARDLLEESKMGIKEISAAVGYQSETSFSKAFRSYSGHAPGAWRQLNRFFQDN